MATNNTRRSGKLLFHEYCCYPFIVELANYFAESKNSELVYCASYQGPNKRTAPDSIQAKSTGLQLDAKKASAFRFVNRLGREREYSRLVVSHLQSTMPTTIVSSNTPSIVQFSILNWATANKVRFVHWVQDLYGLGAYNILKSRLPVIGRMIGKYFMRLDCITARKADHVVVITDKFLPILDQMGVARAKTSVIQNWAPLNAVECSTPESRWPEPSTTVRFVYTGTLAMKHNPNVLLEIASAISTADAELLVVSEGEAANWIEREAMNRNIDNLRVFPFLETSEYHTAVASADVLVAILNADASTVSVPSKILTYLCAGRAVLASIDPLNDAAKTIESANAGCVVSPNNLEMLREKAIALSTNRDLRKTMGINGRAYAEANFDLKRVASRFERIIAT